MKPFLILTLLLVPIFSYSQKSGFDKKNKGFFNITEIGHLRGTGNIKFKDRSDLVFKNTSQAFRLRTIFGSYINPRVSVGLGIGLDGYHGPSYNTMPVFVDVRGYLKDERNTPFAYLDLGYALEVGPAFQKGAFTNLGIGYRTRLSKRKNFVPSIGLNFQQIKDSRTRIVNVQASTIESVVSNINLKSISFNLGIEF